MWFDHTSLHPGIFPLGSVGCRPLTRSGRYLSEVNLRDETVLESFGSVPPRSQFTRDETVVLSFKTEKKKKKFHLPLKFFVLVVLYLSFLSILTDVCSS